MAPNRKSPDIFTNTNGLEILKSTVKAQYLPLTTEVSQSQEPVCVAGPIDPKTEKEPPSVSYWDWPADTLQEENELAVQYEEESKIEDFFSASRIESNLIADSLRRAKEEAPSEEESESTSSYWDWSDSGYDVQSETDSQEKTEHVPEHHCETCCQEYWDWTPEDHKDVCERPSPAHRLHTVLSASRKKYVRQHSHLPDPMEHDEEGVSHHYWHWSEFRSIEAGQ